MISIMLLFASKFFKQQLSATSDHMNMSETKDYVIKLLSTLVTLFLTFLQIPFLMLIFQGFLCGDATSEVMEEITCGST